jgi:DNA-binding CsgD family transcriptional regulator
MTDSQGARANGPVVAKSELIDELADLRRRVQELERKVQVGRAPASPSDDPHPSIFDQLPIAIWEEDWSAAKPLVDEVRRQGIADYRRHFRNNGVLACRIASLTRVVDCNATATTMFRAPDKAAFGRLARSSFLTGEEQLILCDVVAALASGEPRGVVQGWMRTHDGGQIHVRDSLFIPEQHRRTWARVIHATEDRTDRRRAEDALRDTVSLLKETARATGLGHWAWDEVSDRAAYCSQELALIHGLTVEAYYDTLTSYDKFLERVHPQDRERYAAVVEDACRHGKTYDVDYRLIRQTGEIAFVREHGGTHLDGKGKPTRSIGTLQDLTRQKHLDAEHAEIAGRLQGLTPRERQVLDLIVAGETNGGAATCLGITEKTVEAHRAQVMKKLQARGFADLMNKVVTLRADQRRSH